MVTVTTKQMREIEQKAVQSGLELLRLMENAGSAAARQIREKYTVSGAPVAVVCGKGNNGGDGFVIARKLRDEGAKVTVVLACGDPATDDALEMFSRIQEAEIAIVNLETEPYIATSSIKEASLVVDAVYGIGFHGALPDYLRNTFRLINASDVSVVSVDVPSGFNADTGEADPDALKADYTVTFTAMKTGLASAAGREYGGDIIVAAIGINSSLLEPYTNEQTPITFEMVKKCFAERPADSNKGSYGRLLAICGSSGMAGAAVMSVRAALRCGVGLAVSALPRSLYPIAAAQLCEPVFCLLDQAENGDFASGACSKLSGQILRASAILIGCGLGTSSGAESLLLDCLSKATCPIVLDADGINSIAKHINILKTVHAPLILTPHPGEMARLTGLSIDQVQTNRPEIARQFAESYGVTLVLKGYQTLIASPGKPLLKNNTGNPGMATGGSGDVLAGMIASFLAQGMEPMQAAMCGVHLHGLAGDKAAARLSQHAMLPTDMIDELGGLFLILENRS